MAANSILPTGANGTLTQLAKAIGANPTVSDARPEAMSGSGAIIVGFSAKATTASGAKKDFATVAKEARATLDAGYRKLGKTGDVYTTAEEWKTAFGGMDRRSLYAVASSAGGQFSKDEQGAAKYLMAQQQGAAMGLDLGAITPEEIALSILAEVIRERRRGQRGEPKT